MNAQLTEIMRLITNLIRTGVVTEVDRENWLCRVKTGDLETNWISWLTLRAGNARTWWRPSEGEQVVLLSLGGNLETGEAPGTFRLDIGVQDQGITEDTYLELERLISDAKPCSRHMIGMSINLQTSGPHWVGAASYLGEEITIYPYINETIISGGTAHEGGAVHVIDTMRVNP